MARTYYELAGGSVEEVVQSIVAQGPIFTEDEYRHVAVRASPPSPRRSMIIGLICASARQIDEQAYAQAMEHLTGLFHDLL